MSQVAHLSILVWPESLVWSKVLKFVTPFGHNPLFLFTRFHACAPSALVPPMGQIVSLLLHESYDDFQK